MPSGAAWGLRAREVHAGWRLRKVPSARVLEVSDPGSQNVRHFPNCGFRVVSMHRLIFPLRQALGSTREGNVSRHVLHPRLMRNRVAKVWLSGCKRCVDKTRHGCCAKMRAVAQCKTAVAPLFLCMTAYCWPVASTKQQPENLADLAGTADFSLTNRHARNCSNTFSGFFPVQIVFIQETTTRSSVPILHKAHDMLFFVTP